jgi:hypothetical protein
MLNYLYKSIQGLESTGLVRSLDILDKVVEARLKDLR